MRISPLPILGLCATTALAQPNDTQPTVVTPPNQVARRVRAPRPDDAQAQIEMDLKSFLRALNELGSEKIHNNDRISAHLAGGRLGFFGGQEWAVYFVEARSASEFRFDSLEIEALETNSARVRLRYSLTLPAPPVHRVEPPTPAPEPLKMEETLELKRENVPWEGEEKWRIAPPAPSEVPAYRPFSLRHIAYFGGQRAGTLSQLRGEISVGRLKQIGLGALQFVQDYDEQFRFENEFWRDALRPYLRNDALYSIPGTRDLYAFNNNLSDKKLADVDEVARTVLFYEGRDEEPIFRYSGKAAICFVDGHVKLVSGKEVNELIWKP